MANENQAYDAVFVGGGHNGLVCAAYLAKAGRKVLVPDNRYLLTGEGRTKREVAKFSERDAERLSDYDRRLDAIADELRALALQAPPNITARGLFPAIGEMLHAGKDVIRRADIVTLKTADLRGSNRGT